MKEMVKIKNNKREISNANFILRDYNLIDIDDKNGYEILKSFYTSYKKAFPDDDEWETLENIFNYLNKKDKTKNKYHILVLKNNKDIIAGAIFDYLSDVASGIIEYIFVVEKYKRKHLGTNLFKSVVPMTRDYNNRDYIYFWKKQGFKKLEVKYIQPALEANKRTVDKLQIIAKSYNKNNMKMNKKVYEKFLYNFFEFCFKLDDIELYIKTQNLEDVPTMIELKEIEVNNLPNN